MTDVDLMSDPWFAQQTVSDGITLLTEPSVHELLRCNVWHVRGRDRDVVIDTGLGVASLSDAAAQLFESSVVAVATHSHMDHVGGWSEFDDRWIHRLEAEAVATAAEELPLDVRQYDEPTLSALADMGYDIRGGLLLELPDVGFDPATHRLIGAPATRVLDEGDVVDLGDRAYEVLHLPGHSPGSIGLYDPAQRMLFSGDAIYDGPLLDEIPGADVDDYVTTMERLRALPVDVVHGGHGPSMDRPRFVELIDAYLERRT